MSKLHFLYAAQNDSVAAKTLRAVQAALSNDNRNSLSSASKAFAVEGFGTNAAAKEEVSGSLDRLEKALQRELGLVHVDPNGMALTAAKEAALLCGNVKQHIGTPIHVGAMVGQTNFTGIVGGAMGDAMGERMKAAREAYDERDNTSVLENTVTYNLLAGRQAEGAELFFPTVTVPSDNVGISVTIRLYQVMRDKNHSLNGDVIDFERRNIIDGLIDDTILRNDTTRAVPIFRTGKNVDKFMAGVTGLPQVIEGKTYTTAPLRFDTQLNLLSLSADDEMLAAGIMERSDSLDTDVRLVNVYLKVGADVIRVRTDITAMNNFVYVGQDNYRVQKLQLRTQTLYVDKNSRTFANAPLAETDLLPIGAQDYIVRLSGVFTGEVNIESGNLVVEGPKTVKVEAVLDAATKADITAGAGAAVKTALEGGSWAGFDIESRRANSNRRERGDLVDTQYFTQQWALPLRSPVTALRPVNASASTDADDLEKLASTTFIRTTGAGIVTLLDTVNQLRALRGLTMEPRLQPETLGVGRWLVNSLLIEEEVDAAKNVASLTSSELEDDISAMLVNRMRDVYYRLYRDSKFQAVVESGAAGTTEQPSCIALTDPMTGRYLMVKGDIRTVGPDFDLVVKTTPNKRVENKIIMAFGYPKATQSAGSINALHFGAMLWSPELALVLPISRKGQTSKELTVQPRFRHIVNVPVLGVIDVKNLSQVVHKRVPVDFDQI